MTVRDWCKDEAHFDHYMEELAGCYANDVDEPERLAAAVSSGEMAPEEAEKRLSIINSSDLSCLFKMTLVSYSRGDPMEEVASRAHLLFSELGPRGYQAWSDRSNLRVCALAALVCTAGELESLRPVLRPEAPGGGGWWGFDLLLGYDPVSIADEHVGWLGTMCAMWDAPEEERPAVLGQRLSLWYNAMRGEAWWGNHKDPIRSCRYEGYWALELAATARVLRIDDSALEGKRYYPYELAHWLDGQG